MNRGIAFHSLAEEELNDALAFYYAERPALGHAFLKEVSRGLDQILTFPEAAPLVNRVVRRKLLWRFPYGIIYSVTPEMIWILAVAHQKRRPFYWRDRRQQP